MAASDHLSTQFGESPLDYHGQKASRISLHDSGEREGGGTYFKDSPSMVAFADYSPGRSPGETYIRYVSTRRGEEGHGHATNVVNQLINHAQPKGIDFGLVDNPTMDSVRKKVQAQHPDLDYHHKQGFR